MMKKSKLIEKVKSLETHKEALYDRLIEQNNKISELRSENEKLNLDYMILRLKYEKILKRLSEKNTMSVIYNNKVYGITSINHYKSAGENESIIVFAKEVRKSKEIIENIKEPFSNAYEEVKKILFGSEE